MATKRSSKAKKATKNRSKRIPTAKRLESVRTLIVPFPCAMTNKRQH